MLPTERISPTNTLSTKWMPRKQKTISCIAYLTSSLVSQTDFGLSGNLPGFLNFFLIILPSVSHPLVYSQIKTYGAYFGFLLHVLPHTHNKCPSELIFFSLTVANFKIFFSHFNPTQQLNLMIFLPFWSWLLFQTQVFFSLWDNSICRK